MLYLKMLFRYVYLLKVVQWLGLGLVCIVCNVYVIFRTGLLGLSGIQNIMVCRHLVFTHHIDPKESYRGSKVINR